MFSHVYIRGLGRSRVTSGRYSRLTRNASVSYFDLLNVDVTKVRSLPNGHPRLEDFYGDLVSVNGEGVSRVVHHRVIVVRLVQKIHLRLVVLQEVVLVSYKGTGHHFTAHDLVMHVMQCICNITLITLIPSIIKIDVIAETTQD